MNSALKKNPEMAKGGQADPKTKYKLKPIHADRESPQTSTNIR